MIHGCHLQPKDLRLPPSSPSANRQLYNCIYTKYSIYKHLFKYLVLLAIYPFNYSRDPATTRRYTICFPDTLSSS
ncbi:hypothetical protein PM082_009231 [Marasmius tenuissimus]|nr:hypothetical protein PM082_009231 [Marasmius tenuissimus]